MSRFVGILMLQGLVMNSMGTRVSFRTGEVFGAGERFGDAHAAKASALAFERDRLYVGGGGFLSVYDVSGNPLRPRLLGTTEDMASVRQLAVQDGMAYVVTRGNGLWIADCRAGAPRTVGHLPSTSNCTGVDVAGNVCFIGGSKSGIDFVDVSDPARPQLIANRRQEPVESQSVAYRDGCLYSGEWGGRCVTVWDCHDLADIKRTDIAKLPSNGDGIWPSGPWLYACTGWSSADKKLGAQPHPGQMGLSVFDRSDPAHLKEVGRVDFEYCKADGLDMWIPRSGGDLVFCAQNLSGLYAVDVSDRSCPRVLDRWTWNRARGKNLERRIADGQPSACVASVAVGMGVVYVAGPGGLGAWAIPAKGAKVEPVVRGQPPVGAALRPPCPPAPKGFRRWLPEDRSRAVSVTGTSVRDDVCYAACGTAGLYALALSGSGIREVTRFDLPECTDVSCVGNRLFVAAGRGGFIGYEIAKDGKLEEFLRIHSRGARDVLGYGDGTRWIACNTTVYDISDPKKPRSLVQLVHQARWSKFMVPDLLGGRWVGGNSARKSFGWADLQAEPVAETVMADYVSQMGTACALRDKALLVDGGNWAVVEPGAVKRPEMHPFPETGFARGIPRSSGTVVAVSSGRRIGVWDFADPSVARHLKTYSLTDGSEPVSFWKGRLVVPGWSAGVLMSESWFGD